MKLLCLLVAALGVAFGGALLYAPPSDRPSDFTTELRLDTMGTKGFQVKRTIPDRVTGSPDPIFVARESLVAQRNLCPAKFDVQEIKISNAPPNLTYEAKIRCH